MRIFVEFDGKQQYNIGFPTFKLPENNKKTVMTHLLNIILTILVYDN